MPKQVHPPASDILREKRSAPKWSRLLPSPIRLLDGTVLFTLKDAAQRILYAPPTPSVRIAANVIIEAALHGVDMATTQVAVRLPLHKNLNPPQALR